MPDEKKGEVRWLPQPEDHDYPSAAGYLSLLESDDVVSSIVASLMVAPIQNRKAKDILRAARLVLLPEDNAHVASHLKKIKEGKKLSPILMIKGDLARGIPAEVADGYLGFAQATTRTKTPTFQSNWLTRTGNHRKPTAMPFEGGTCRSYSFR